MVLTLQNKHDLRTVSLYRCCLTDIGIPVIKIIRAPERLIFIKENTIPGKMVFIFKTGPRCLVKKYLQSPAPFLCQIMIQSANTHSCVHLIFPHHTDQLICPPGQNGRHFTDEIFKCIFMIERFCILIEISPNFVPQAPIDNRSSLVRVMGWRRTGDKALSDAMLTQFGH